MATRERPDADDADRRRLHELGYAQELVRSLDGFASFAISFTVISVLSGCLTLYGYGMATGGPALIVWGWPVVGLMTLLVGLSMAEVCSSYPTAGGLYFWAAKLAPAEQAPAWAWFTGWFNFLGQVACTAGIDFGAASFLNALLDLQFGFAPSPPRVIALFGAILLLHALVNTLAVGRLAAMNVLSVWWHVLGVAVVAGALAFVPDRHQSASFVFGSFVNRTGWESPLYVSLLGLLLAQYTFTGYDASAHMTEETRDAAVAGPRGIVSSILVSLVAGWVLLVALTFAIRDYDRALASPTGVPPAQIFLDALGPAGGKALLVVAIGAQLFCGLAAMTTNSRMIWAFSRDGALPGSSIWHRVDSRTRTPVAAVWLAAACAFALGLPYLWNATAYAAVTSISVVGLYVAYVIPTWLRLRKGDDFERGPWHLGRWSRPVGCAAVAWVAFIGVLFLLPTTHPVTPATFNYTPVALAVVVGFAWAWWIVSARHWFRGPRVHGSAEEIAAIERELESLGG